MNYCRPPAVPVRLLRLPVDAQVPGLLHGAQLHALEVEDLREAELRVGLVQVEHLEKKAQDQISQVRGSDVRIGKITKRQIGIVRRTYTQHKQESNEWLTRTSNDI